MGQLSDRDMAADEPTRRHLEGWAALGALAADLQGAALAWGWRGLSSIFRFPTRRPAPRIRQSAVQGRCRARWALIDGQGLQFIPQRSAAPYPARGERVEVMPECWREPSGFGPMVYVLYLTHRRNTRKVKRFIEYLAAFLREKWCRAGVGYP